MGSHFHSEDQSFEGDARQLTHHHEAHESHHRDLEARLRADYERRLREAQDKATRESQLFQEIIETIVACFSEKGVEVDDFSNNLSQKVKTLQPKIERVFEAPLATKIDTQLSNLAEHFLSFELKLRDTREKKEELEAIVIEQSRREPGDGLLGSSRVGAFRSPRKGDLAGDPLDFLSEAEDKSLQDRHDQLNESGDFRLLANERNHSLRTALQEILEDFKKELANRRIFGEEQVQQKHKELLSALSQFQKSHWTGAFGIINHRGEIEGEHPTSKVIFEGEDFELLLQCLDLHHQILALKGGRGRSGVHGPSRDILPLLLTADTMNDTVKGLFARKNSPDDQSDVALSAVLPTFEAMVGVFVEAVAKELESSGAITEASLAGKTLKCQMLSLLNFNADFLFNFTQLHDIYLSGLTGCSLITSYLVELALEIAQQLVKVDPSHNHLIGDLKELHEKGVRTFRDKHHKATTVGLSLAEEGERVAHLADLRRDFEEFWRLVDGEGRAITSKLPK